MSRRLILGAASVLAMTASQAALAAGPTIVGGGSSLVANDVGNNNLSPVTTGEFALYTGATFIYQKSGSGAGRNAVLENNEECNVANVGFGTACPAVGTSPAPVAFGNTDAVLTASELAFANTANGQNGAVVNTTYGDLVQLPFLGTGVSIPEHEATGTINAKTGIQTSTNVKLTDSDLCGIFSGKITNWSGTSAASVLGNHAITVIYRGDSSGTSFLFTNHLSAVCSTTGSAPNSAITFTAQSTFANEFLPNAVPANFVAETGSSAVQAAVAATTYAVGYVSPDYTHMVKNPPAPPVGTVPFVASVAKLGAAASTGVLPSTANITSALNSVASGQNAAPPTGTNQANPTLWVPIVQTSTNGYPIVGYTNMVVPQCFNTASATIGTNLVSFLTAHYNTAAYLAVQSANGFVPLPNLVDGLKFKKAVITSLLSPKTSIYSISSTDGGCTGHTGRGVGTN